MLKGCVHSPDDHMQFLCCKSDKMEVWPLLHASINKRKHNIGKQQTSADGNEEQLQFWNSTNLTEESSNLEQNVKNTNNSLAWQLTLKQAINIKYKEFKENWGNDDLKPWHNNLFNMLDNLVTVTNREKPRQTCIQTSFESPCTWICLKPFLRASFNPKIKPRYSATLLVATPKPSRIRATFIQILSLERWMVREIKK